MEPRRPLMPCACCRQAGWLVVLDLTAACTGCHADPGQVRRAWGVAHDESRVVVVAVDEAFAATHDLECSACHRPLVEGRGVVR